MTADGTTFNTRVTGALADPQLKQALSNVRTNFVAKRAAAKAMLPEWGDLSNEAKAIKDHTLAHLDVYLEAYEKKATAAGAKVHWAATAAEARGIILQLCQEASAKTVTKGKSMVGEEIHLNQHLEVNGITPMETDLGEYIIQLRGEIPSHIIAPAVHLTKGQVEADFRRTHTHLAADRSLSEPHRTGGRGARHPARQLPVSRCRHHGRELPDRRDRHLGHRHQRGQWRPDANPAQDAYCHRVDRESDPDAGGCQHHRAIAGALGDRPGHFNVHDLFDRPQARRRPRWP